MPNILLLDPVGDQSSDVAALLRSERSTGRVWYLDWSRSGAGLISYPTLSARMLKELHPDVVRYAESGSVSVSATTQVLASASQFFLLHARPRRVVRPTALEAMEAFRVYIRFFQRFLPAFEIDVVIANPPSYGFDFACIEVAEIAGIKVIIVNELMFRRFAWSRSLGDWGDFDATPPLFPAADVTEVEPPFRRPPYA